MYAFPRIHLPPKAIQKAKENMMEPDVFYALRLLEESGESLSYLVDTSLANSFCCVC